MNGAELLVAHMPGTQLCCYNSCMPAQRLRAAAAGILFQYPGLLIAALVGAGAANVLKHPAPWLHGLTSGACCQSMQAAADHVDHSTLGFQP